METIKFRAWNPDDNKMEFPLVFAIGDDDILKPLIKCSDGNRAYKNYPLMLFTCREDINRVEIYEGDKIEGIYAGSDQILKGVVEYDEENCSFVAAQTPLWTIENIRVVGNIYENLNQ